MTLTADFDASLLTQTDGTVLTSWPDQSAFQYQAVATSPRAPIVKTNIQNGLRGVLFDGVDDWMNWHPVVVTKYSRLVAFKWVGPTAAGNGDPRIWESYAGGLMVHSSDGSLRLLCVRSTSIGDYRTAAGVIQAGKSYLVEVYRNINVIGTPPEVWVNGAKVALNTISVESGTSTGDSFMILGNVTSNVNGTRSINAYFFEAQFYDTILDDTTKASTRSALITKWGLGGAIRSKISAGSEQTSGKIPTIVLSKDTVRGKISFSSVVSSVRSTPSPAKRQLVQHNLTLSGAASRKFPRTAFAASMNLSGSLSAQITELTGTLISANIWLSGRLIPTIVTDRDHHCRECIKRWFHRWLSRSD